MLEFLIASQNSKILPSWCLRLVLWALRRQLDFFCQVRQAYEFAKTVSVRPMAAATTIKTTSDTVEVKRRKPDSKNIGQAFFFCQLPQKRKFLKGTFSYVGCVRYRLMHTSPRGWDVDTSSNPEANQNGDL